MQDISRISSSGKKHRQRSEKNCSVLPISSIMCTSFSPILPEPKNLALKENGHVMSTSEEKKTDGVEIQTQKRTHWHRQERHRKQQNWRGRPFVSLISDHSLLKVESNCWKFTKNDRLSSGEIWNYEKRARSEERKRELVIIPDSIAQITVVSQITLLTWVAQNVSGRVVEVSTVHKVQNRFDVQIGFPLLSLQ